MDCVDKEAVRRDFVRGMSTRQLAAKYGVGKTTIIRWIKEGGWTPAARAAREARETRSGPVRTSGPPIGPEDKLPVDKLYEALEAKTMQLLGKADDLLSLDEPLAPRDLKSLSSMLLDVRQLLGILSPREAAEQEIRLIMLRKQAQADEKKHEDVTVRFVDTDGAEA